jgi:hypothetical protein
MNNSRKSFLNKITTSAQLFLIIFYGVFSLFMAVSTANAFPYLAGVRYTTGDGPRSVFAADLDGDSDIDLAVVNNIIDTVSVFFKQWRRHIRR